MGYPEEKFEKEILKESIDVRSVESLSAVEKKEAVIESIQQSKNVRVDDSLDDYILKIVQETRQSPFLELGVSPRGALALKRAAQSTALVEGRNYMIPDDIKKVALPVLTHRVILKSFNGEPESQTTEKIVQEILDRVTVPM